MVDEKHRCLFVHIPKTAGKSIQRFLGLPWANHKDLGKYADEIPSETFSSLFKFAIVRNPWDRLVSDYVFQTTKKGGKSVALHAHDEHGNKRGFRDWLEMVMREPRAYPPETWGGEVSAGIHRWSPQMDWLKVNGLVAVDEVLRFERLSEDFVSVAERLGFGRAQLPCRNWRFHWHYTSYYDASTRKLVADYYGEDIEEFRYLFGRESRGGVKYVLDRVCLRVRGWMGGGKRGEMDRAVGARMPHE